MAKIYPVIRRTTEVVQSGDRDITFEDAIDVDDAIDAGTVTLPETADLSDAIDVGPATAYDDLDLSDTQIVTGIDATSQDAVAFAESTVPVSLDRFPSDLAVDAVLPPLTVIPDDTVDLGDVMATDIATSVTDDLDLDESSLLADFIDMRPTQDSWTDEGNPTDNHETATDLFIQQGVIGVQDGQRAFIAWDLTGLTGWEGVPGDDAVTVTVIMDPPLVNVAATLTTRSLIQASQPWTESGITWNNQPTHPTVEDETLLNLIAAGFAHTFTLTSTVDDVLGNWVSVQLSFEALVAVVGIFSARSREQASLSSRPRISFLARHAGVAS